MRAGIFASAVVPGGGGFSAGYLGSAGDEANSATYTFSAQSLGTPDAARSIVVAIGTRGSSPGAVTAVTVAGVSASPVADPGSTSNVAALWEAAVPSGMTGDVVVTFDDSRLRCAIGLWELTGAHAVTDTDTAASKTVNLDGGDFGIAVTVLTGTYSFAWDGATERFDLNVEAFTASGADTDTPGTMTATASGGTSQFTAAASFSAV